MLTPWLCPCPPACALMLEQQQRTLQRKSYTHAQSGPRNTHTPLPYSVHTVCVCAQGTTSTRAATTGFEIATFDTVIISLHDGIGWAPSHTHTHIHTYTHAHTLALQTSFLPVHVHALLQLLLLPLTFCSRVAAPFLMARWGGCRGRRERGTRWGGGKWQGE